MLHMLCLVAQSCLCDPTDCSPPGSSVHGIPQARILEWVAVPSSRGIFPSQGLNPGLLCCRQILYCLSHQGSPMRVEPFPKVSAPDTIIQGLRISTYEFGCSKMGMGH